MKSVSFKRAFIVAAIRPLKIPTATLLPIEELPLIP
jgi:hypothetical protein